MCIAGESSTVDKEGIGCTLKKIIIRTKEDRFHRGVISNHGEYNIGLGGHCGKSLSVITVKLGGECRGGILIYIVYTADSVSLSFRLRAMLAPMRPTPRQILFL